MFWGNFNNSNNVNNIDKEIKMIKEAAELCCWCKCAGIKILSIYESEVDLQINLISRFEGRDHIIKVVRSLAEEVKLKKVKNDEIDVGEFDKRLSKPQLLILFSPRIEFDGFPPWHIHLTEI
ncbi:23322_t:CDS:2, partial [Entrophospora sp. SA101]